VYNKEVNLFMLCAGMKAQLVKQSGDNARLKIRERELQQEVHIITAVLSPLISLASTCVYV